IAGMKKRLESEKKRKVEVENSKMDKEQMAIEAERMHSQAVERAGELSLQLKLAKEELLKAQQELYKERENERTKMGEISGLLSAIKNVKARIAKVDAERQRQQ
ncbi:NBP2b protein, putative, partial [Perkinsus marinus ATCC 50983]